MFESKTQALINVERKRVLSLPNNAQPLKTNSISDKIGQNTHIKKTIIQKLSESNFMELGNNFGLTELKRTKRNEDCKYTHKMEIDFGHIEQPSWVTSRKSKVTVPIPQQFERVNESLLEKEQPKEDTKRKEKKYKSLIKLMKYSNEDEDLNQQNCEDENIKIQNPYSKPLQASKASKPNIQNSPKTQPKSTQKSTLMPTPAPQRTRLKKVLATPKPLTPILSIQSPSPDNLLTHRKPPSCKLVREYVGGSGMKLKVIKYPDNEDYINNSQSKMRH